jgi:DNA-binding NarL/FixJ family response regulator
LKVVAEPDDGKQAIELILQEKPDIAIVDYSLPLINGLDVLRQVKPRKSNAEIVIFTMRDSDNLAEERFHFGARAVVLKSEPQQLVSAAIEAAAAHKPFAGGVAAGKRLERRPNHNGKSGKPSLTPRERAILKLVCEEHTSKQRASSSASAPGPSKRIGRR